MSADQPGGQPIIPARDVLVALLTAERPDWNRAELDKVLWDLAYAGATFEAYQWCAFRALYDRHARPQTIRRLWEQTRPEHDHPKPGDAKAGLARARAELRRIRDNATRQEAPSEHDDHDA